VKRKWLLLAPAMLLVSLAGCNPKVTIEPIEIKPIYMTLDVNIKVDRELDNFFDFEKTPGGRATPPATAPAPNASGATEGGM
jgi:hypothetical protein